MAVQYEMMAGLARVERAHDVRHGRLGRDHAKGQSVRFEKSRDVGRREGRVAGRVRTLGADELTQELDDRVAIVVDPRGELLLDVGHVLSPPGAS